MLRRKNDQNEAHETELAAGQAAGSSLTEDEAFFENEVTAKKQRMLLVGVAGALVMVGMAYILFGSEKPEIDGAEQVVTTQVSTDELLNQQELGNEYFSMYEAEVGEQARRIDTLERGDPRLAEMESEIASLRGQNSELTSDGQRVFEAYEQENALLRQQVAQARQQPQRAAPRAAATAIGLPGSSAAAAPSAAAPAVTPRRRKRNVTLTAFEGAGGGTARRVSASEGSTVYSDSANYLPPNSLAKATVIVGVDATTNVSSQSDPLPVVLRITGPARSVFSDGQLLRTRVQGCLVNGAAQGDLSSEKVYVKLLRMTCPQPGGGVAVSNVKGFVAFGGKVGVRGRVVSREGSLTTQAFLAGLVGGAGDALSSALNFPLQQTTLGAEGVSNDTPSIGNVALRGLGGGAQQAGTTLSDYLIERAEQYQPVIEMPTGAQVEVVFLDGTFIRN